MKSIFILVLGIFAFPSLQAQVNKEQRKEMMNERIKSQKVAFITTELNLTVDEAQNFWPVYNKYEEKRAELKIEQRDLPTIKSETEADKAIDQYLKGKEAEHALNKAYFTELKSNLPSSKIFKLIQLEKQFKEELVRRVKQRMKRKMK